MTHCFKCGTPHKSDSYPKHCDNCRYTHWKDPSHSYVCAVLIPFDGGLLGLIRGIQPQKGGIALVGGFANPGETLREAAAREAFEESGLKIAPDSLVFFDERIASDGHNLEFFLAPEGCCTELPKDEDIPEDFRHENQGFVVIRKDTAMCFPMQSAVVQKYFSKSAN